MDYKAQIDLVLAPLVGKECILLNLPYYPNPGDSLIWEGIELFFVRHGVTCVYRSAWSTFKYRDISTETVVCLMGGGNFGDLWAEKGESMLSRVVQMYPKNRIVIFPQSVYYQNTEFAKQEAAAVASHKELYICARDEQSLALLQKYFSANHLLLAPDMAFYVDIDQYRGKVQKTGKILFLKRDDKESISYDAVQLPDQTEMSDWPMHQLSGAEIQAEARRNRWHRRMVRVLLPRLKGKRMQEGVLGMLSIGTRRRMQDDKISVAERWKCAYCEYLFLLELNQNYNLGIEAQIDELMYLYHRPLLIRYAVEYIDQYDAVISTRLHSGVIAMMLGKETIMIDNSYGKISGVYNLWLKEETNIRVL